MPLSNEPYQQEPVLDEWRELYAEAEAFRAASPWHLLHGVKRRVASGRRA